MQTPHTPPTPPPYNETIPLLFVAACVAAMVLGFLYNGNFPGAIAATIFLCAVIVAIVTPVKK